MQGNFQRSILMLTLEYKAYNLLLEHEFRISRGVRSSTPIMLISIEFEGVKGFGEASMPPLYGESWETAGRFLSQVNLARFKDPFDIEAIIQYVDAIAPGNTASKASIDVALHDLIGKLTGSPTYRFLNLPGVEKIGTSKTISIDSLEVTQKRVLEAKEFPFLKVKLGTENDKAIIKAVRAVSDQPLFVDANQGWKDKSVALENIHWLNEHGVVFIEQPMPVEMKREIAWLKSESPLPLIGDESIQRLTDVVHAEDFYHGINIKLVKSTGLYEGLKMATLAKEKGMQVMLGCMSETSCLISAAFQLASLADWVDLDGNLNLKNNPYRGIEMHDGNLYNNDIPGIGLINPEEAWEKISEEETISR